MRGAPPLSVALAIASTFIVGASAVAAPTLVVPTWPAVLAPSGGPARVIGGANGACIGGAVALPLEGVGYQAVDLSRRRYYGHPVLVAFVTDLGREVHKRQLGTLLVGDMAQPRGGPMSSEVGGQAV